MKFILVPLSYIFSLSFFLLRLELLLFFLATGWNFKFSFLLSLIRTKSSQLSRFVDVTAAISQTVSTLRRSSYDLVKFSLSIGGFAIVRELFHTLFFHVIFFFLADHPTRSFFRLSTASYYFSPDAKLRNDFVLLQCNVINQVTISWQPH